MDAHLESNPEQTGSPETSVGQDWKSTIHLALPLFGSLHFMRNHGQDLSVAPSELIQAVTQLLQLSAADRSPIAVEEEKGNPPAAILLKSDSITFRHRQTEVRHGFANPSSTQILFFNCEQAAERLSFESRLPG